MFWKKKPKVENPKGPALSCVHFGVCSKERCPLWVTLNMTDNFPDGPKNRLEGRCSFAWTPELLIELRHHLSLALQKPAQRVD